MANVNKKDNKKIQLLSPRGHRLYQRGGMWIMSRNRRAYREKKKQEKWQKRLLYGLPGMKNEFGKMDLTAYNAARVIAGRISIDEIKV